MKFTNMFKHPVDATALGVLAPADSRVLTGGGIGAPDVVAHLIDSGQTPATAAAVMEAFTDVMRYAPSCGELDTVMRELESVGLAA